MHRLKNSIFLKYQKSRFSKVPQRLNNFRLKEIIPYPYYLVSLLLTPYSLLLTPYSLLPTPYSLLLITRSYILLLKFLLKKYLPRDDTEFILS